MPKTDIPKQHGSSEAAKENKRKLPSSILFLCTQNAVRSPMAASIMQKLCGNKVFIDSAGVATKDVDGYAVAVMREIGIDISNHVSLSIEALSLPAFDLVICFSNEAKQYAEDICKTVATEFEYWPVYDPVNQAEGRSNQLEHYRKLRMQLDELLNTNFDIKSTVS